MTDKSTQIDLRESDQSQYFITAPHWLLKRGASFLLFIIVLSIIGAIIFRYPDKISARFTLTSNVPPVSLNARATGRLTNIFVEHRASVSEGSPLFVIENGANYADIQTLDSFLTQTSQLDRLEDAIPQLNSGLQLGELQSLYANLVHYIQQLNRFNENPYYTDKSSNLAERLLEESAQYGLSQQQIRIKEMQLHLTKLQTARDSSLYQQGLLSSEDWERAQTRLLVTHNELLTTKTSANIASQNQRSTREALINLEQERRVTSSNLLDQIKTLSLQLASSIRDWELKYVLKAPVTGKVIFTKHWVINQQVQIDEHILSIIPPNAHAEPIARILMPMKGSGKVCIGQRVHLDCHSFPKAEYGILVGKVYDISPLPIVVGNQSFYNVDVKLNNGLKTTYGKNLPYFLSLEGNAEIITDDISLMQRILNPIRKLLDNNKR